MGIVFSPVKPPAQKTVPKALFWPPSGTGNHATTRVFDCYNFFSGRTAQRGKTGGFSGRFRYFYNDLAMLEGRFSLLEEGRHPLFLVLRGKKCVDHASLEQQGFRQRGFIGAIDRLLQGHQRL